ncbi:MAG: glycosyltransferase family 2 protein [Cyanobacteria bacterium J06635_13]
MLQTPVAFLIFNRPQNTQRVFAEIRKAQPRKLLVVADGHRADRPEEAAKCAATRAVIDGVDWDCEVLTNYADTNLGCRDRVATGLDWVFSQVEEAIILEDDCLPDPSFFSFCARLLAEYRHQPEVMAICGSNFMTKWKHRHQSYHFSYYFNCWGWASWRRAWEHYDVNVRDWQDPTVRAQIKDFIQDERQYSDFAQVFERNYARKLNTWDYAFAFACLKNQGRTITSSVNLISNIGFGADATHTVSNSGNIVANLPRYSAMLPLKPPMLEIDRQYTYEQYSLVWDLGLTSQIRRKLKSWQTQLAKVSS